MVQTTLLRLPKARKVIPQIAARWNHFKGRVDEMTRYDDCMIPFAKGTLKQQWIMREFKKIMVNAKFILKHCFPTKPTPWQRAKGTQQFNAIITICEGCSL